MANFLPLEKTLPHLTNKVPTVTENQSTTDLKGKAFKDKIPKILLVNLWPNSFIRYYCSRLVNNKILTLGKKKHQPQ
jgi:hypothetical protein